MIDSTDSLGRSFPPCHHTAPQIQESRGLPDARTCDYGIDVGDERQKLVPTPFGPVRKVWLARHPQPPLVHLLTKEEAQLRRSEPKEDKRGEELQLVQVAGPDELRGHADMAQRLSSTTSSSARE